jgi:hypothetical protein
VSGAVRRTVTFLVLPLLLVGLFTLYTSSRGEAELRSSDAAFAAGELARSLSHARYAASAYVPGASHVDAAYVRLQAIALRAERAGDRELEASAWQAMRVAALESSHFWSPHERERAQADARLAQLHGVASGAAAGLGRRLAPGALRLLLGLGFLGAVGSLSWFCTRAWSASGHWQLSRAAVPVLGWCAGMLALGWALWRV